MFSCEISSVVTSLNAGKPPWPISFLFLSSMSSSVVHCKGVRLMACICICICICICVCKCISLALTSGWWVMALVGKPRRRPGLAPPEEPGSHRQVAQLWTSVVGKRAGFGTRDTRTHKTKSFCVFSSCLWMISVSQHNTSCSTAWEPALVMGECLLMVITCKHPMSTRLREKISTF